MLPPASAPGFSVPASSFAHATSMYTAPPSAYSAPQAVPMRAEPQTATWAAPASANYFPPGMPHATASAYATNSVRPSGPVGLTAPPAPAAAGSAQFASQVSSCSSATAAAGMTMGETAASAVGSVARPYVHPGLPSEPAPASVA